MTWRSVTTTMRTLFLRRSFVPFGYVCQHSHGRAVVGLFDVDERSVVCQSTTASVLLRGVRLTLCACAVLYCRPRSLVCETAWLRYLPSS